MEEKKFVDIVISERQVIATKKDSNEPLFVSKNGIEFGKILCPEGGTLWYPLKNIKVYDNQTKQAADGTVLRLYKFSQPSGTEMEVHYSNGENQEDTVKKVTIDELKDMFQQSKKEYAQANSTFVNMQVPSDWGKTSENHPETVRVSIPIEIDGNKDYYTFFLDSQKNWHESTKKEGYHYFGFPRMGKDGAAWQVNLSGNVKDESGQYLPKDQQPTLTVTSAELKEYVDAAVKGSIDKHINDTHSLLDDMNFDKNATAEATPAVEEEASRPIHRTR